MKRRRRYRRPPVVREERVEATPQTLAKLEPDPLRLLLDSDAVRECRCGRVALEEAAEEIGAVYFAITRAVMWKRANVEGNKLGFSGDIPDALASAHAHTYAPWASHWGKTAVLEAVIDVIVDRYQTTAATPSTIVMALADYAKRMRERPKHERAA